MTDEAILDLFWRRSEDALRAVAEQYGKYLTRIAQNVLHRVEDAEECVNDAYLTAWEQIPPDRPAALSPYLGRIARCKALNRYDYLAAQKRSADFTLQLSELEECLAGGGAPDEDVDAAQLGASISAFLRGQKPEARMLFIRRYWYSDSISDLAKRFHMSEGKIKTSLFRTRNGLRAYLQKEGYDL